MKKTYLIIIYLCLTLLLQAQISKTVNITAGGLYSTLSVTEKNTVTNLTVTGTIDASDFKTMRDNMPLLAIIDLSGTTIIAYSGQLGTRLSADPITSYPANTIPYKAFFYYKGDPKLISFKFPSGVTYIDDYAFYGCIKLSSLTIPSSVTYIGNEAFLNCSGLTSINFPSGVTTINYNCFSGCSGLTSIDIPSTITSIGNQAFYHCSGLTSLKIPSSITTIDIQAFAGCVRLASIYVYSNPLIVLGSSSAIFWEVNKNTCILYVPIGTLNDYRTANQWNEFNNVVEVLTTDIDLFKTNNLILYPNPVTHGFQVNGIKGLSILRLSDINGKVLLTKEVNNNEYISVSSLPKGMYIVKISSEGKEMEQKIIKN